MQIRKATRQRKRIRVAIDGPSGGGKTYTLLRLAHAMKVRGLCHRILVVDTENESASLYVGEQPDGEPFDFDTICLKSYAPGEFVGAIKLAEREKYDCIIIDSLSHAWVGEGGALDQIDKKSSGNSFAAWKDVTPQHRAMIDAIIQSTSHMLVSMRSKTEYVLIDEVNRQGKTVKVPKKIGMAPVQRDGMEYEFDLYGSMDWEHVLKITKSRCSSMQDKTACKPGATFWMPLFDWLDGAADGPGQTVAQDPRTHAERERDDFLVEFSKAATQIQLDEIAGRVKARGFAAEIRNPLGAAYKQRKVEIEDAAKLAEATRLAEATNEPTKTEAAAAEPAPVA